MARFGGDEFCVLAAVTENAGLPASRPPASGCDRQADGVVGEHALRLSTSVGIAYVEAEGAPETLVRQADAAMYGAKGTAEGIAVYEPWMREAALRRLDGKVSAGGSPGAESG